MHPPTKGNEPGGSQALNRLMGRRLQTLAGILSEIEEFGRARLGISEAVVAELDDAALELRNKLLELEHWPVGGAPHIDQLRQNLEQRHETLVRERRAEILQRWRDLAQLAQESRTWLKEHSDLAQKMDLLADGKRTDRDRPVV